MGKNEISMAIDEDGRGSVNVDGCDVELEADAEAWTASVLIRARVSRDIGGPQQALDLLYSRSLRVHDAVGKVRVR